DYQGKKVLITAGPTRERLDPIRFLSNFSSGKMGYSIAEAFKNRGADVTIVSGPVNLSAPSGVIVINVESTDDMFQAVKEHMDADIALLTAAVSDFTIEEPEPNKIKKLTSQIPSIERSETIDILKYVGSNWESMYVVALAVEAQDGKTYALATLDC